MKKFVTHIAWIALAIILTLALAEVLLRSVPNTYRYKDTWMRRHHREVKTLILGNSLTLQGINPWMMDTGTFNLANSAQQLEHDRYLLEHYAPCDSLRTVIICLGENLFVGQLEDEPSLAARAGYYKMYMGYDKHPWWSEYNFELARLDVSWAKYKAFRQLRRSGKSLACDSLGFAPEYLEHRPAGWQHQGLGSTWKGIDYARAYIRSNLTRLVQIAQYCHTHHIRLVVVSPPLWKPLPQDMRTRYVAAGHWLEHRYGTTYLDYTGDSRFGADDFYDAHHLNECGARKLTVILMDDMSKFGGVAK